MPWLMGLWPGGPGSIAWATGLREHHSKNKLAASKPFSCLDLPCVRRRLHRYPVYFTAWPLCGLMVTNTHQVVIFHQSVYLFFSYIFIVTQCTAGLQQGEASSSLHCSVQAHPLSYPSETFWIIVLNLYESWSRIWLLCVDLGWYCTVATSWSTWLLYSGTAQLTSVQGRG